MTPDRTNPGEVGAAVVDLLGELTAAERRELIEPHLCVRCWMPHAGCSCRPWCRKHYQALVADIYRPDCGVQALLKGGSKAGILTGITFNGG